MLSAICSSCSSLWDVLPDMRQASQSLYHFFIRIVAAPAGYLVKISIYRFTALNDPFSQWIMAPTALAVVNFWKKTQGLPPQDDKIDPVRLERSACFLREFAEVRTFRTSDGKEIQWALYRPEKFQQWITANGGIRLGEWIVPRQADDWTRLQRLGEFKCFERRGMAFRVPAYTPQAQNHCVMRFQGFGRTMTMDKSYIGKHLAAGLNYAIFDWRAENSIKGYFEDAEGCFQAVRREGFLSSQIKLLGSCRATFIAVYLKARHHAEGVETVLIQPPPSLQAAIDHQPFPSNWIGRLGIRAVEGEGEEHFDSIRRLRALPSGGGRLCLILSEGDKTLPSDISDQFIRAASHAGPLEIIWDKQNHEIDSHFTEPLFNEDIFRRYVQFLVR